MTPALQTKYNNHSAHGAPKSAQSAKSVIAETHNHTINGTTRENVAASMLLYVIEKYCNSRPRILNTSTLEGEPIHIEANPKEATQPIKPQLPNQQSTINNQQSTINNPIIARIARTHKIQHHKDSITFNWFTYPTKITFKE